ncbi:glycosyltransferase family 9 protein [Phaeovibrio sulfidiphilus]|uniref:Glycosyltransferase family 9 protein n=1 Tax=Phaeovibrio sulfidiphilus TaxID=1220600 RepID=A0A8J6YM75_9PROT|nr:glycosyltransferase family 9 protein [Phaeovibrio sulfidiphilus]MBE1236995.1 glycosyltransferase family 9 protein [Phaeovibrio sulfidiphilus]
MSPSARSGSPREFVVFSGGEIIGDGMFKLPFVRALRAAMPENSRLVWMTTGDTVYRTLLKDLTEGLVDEYLRLPPLRVGYRDLLGPPVLDRQFDTLMDTQHKIRRTLWLRNRLSSRTFVSGSLRGFLSSPLSKARPAGPPTAHLLDRLFRIGEAAVGAPLKPVPLVLPDTRWDETARSLLDPERPCVGLVPGSGDPKKRWPLERFVALARGLVRIGMQPVFVLGPQEAGIAATLREQVPEALFPLEQVPGADPCLTIALARRLHATVANDSGGSHLVAAAGRPMVCLFRSANVRDKYAPRLEVVRALAPQDFGKTDMGGLTVRHVEEALFAVLGAAAPPPPA